MGVRTQRYAAWDRLRTSHGTRSLRAVVVTAGIAAIVTAASATQGAYFSESWGWLALAFLIPTTLVLMVGHPTAPGRLSIAFALLMLGLATWTALSSVWSLSAPGSVREFERMVVYVSVALAVASVLRFRDVTPVLAGVLLGTSLISAYSLATRVIPDHFVTDDDPFFENRLAQPLGYPNALGALAAIAILIAFGFVSHGPPRLSVAAAAVIPLDAATLYFTYSRGAWVALALSFAAAMALDPKWLRSLCLSSFTAVPSVAGVLIASRQDTLTRIDVPIIQAAHEGHRLAFILSALAACSALFACLACATAARVKVSARATRLVSGLCICAVIAGMILAVVAVGGPARGVSRVKEGFETLPVGGTADLDSRLFKFYGSGRREIWPVAWAEFRQAPLVGEGAGSFEYVWYEERTNTRIVRDAHSLYLESLGELGLMGFGLLVLALLMPLVAGLAARRSRLVPFGLAAYLGWAGACAVDWHWEMTGLTVTALLAGSAGLLARNGTTGLPFDVGRRLLALTISIALSLFAVVSLVGNQALFAARAESSREVWPKARDDARRARALIFWSFEPDLALGDAQAGIGSREGAVRAYRDAARKDPQNWVVWLRLAQVARGAERRMAYAKVHELNPLETDLPGETSSG